MKWISSGYLVFLDREGRPDDALITCSSPAIAAKCAKALNLLEEQK